MRTALGFQERTVIHTVGRSTGWQFPDEMLNGLRPSQSLLLRPITITPADVRIEHPALGRGAFGYAYRCKVSDHDLVVKVPLAAAPLGWAQLPDSAPLDAEDLTDFAKELRNAARLLEPVAFSNATQLNAEQARALRREMDTMRAHPGYEHIHRIVHGESAPYPMLFSEACEGTLWERLQTTDWSTDSPEWRSLACQMLSAFDYTRTRELYHCDIKTDNIFYIGERYMLADFGLASSAQHDLSAAQLCGALVASLGGNLRLKRTLTQPRPPFAAPLQRIARDNAAATDVLPRLWTALGLSGFAPYETSDMDARLDALEKRRPQWMIEREAREARIKARRSF